MRRFPKIILVFMGTDWSIYMRRPFLFSLGEAAQKLRTTVVAVNRPLCPWSTFIRKPHRVGEFFGKPRLQRLAECLYLYSPKYFIHDHVADLLPLLQKLNLVALRQSYRHLQHRLSITEPTPIIWFNYPQQGYVTRLWPDSFRIFELYDNLVNFSGKESKRINRLEEKIRKCTDLLVTTSRKLQDKYASNYRHVYLLGNGLSRHVYEQLAVDDYGGIKAITALPSPRIGYAGMISERLDWKLITALVSREPKWSFIFVGRVVNRRRTQKLQKYGNIWFIGEYEHSAMPAVWRSFDVGIMPYLDNVFFRFLNPLKFYEMAAAGLPSVSSNIEELQQFPPELVSVQPNDPDRWRDSIRTMLALDRQKVLAIGRSVARQYIWEDMAANLTQALSNLIAQR
jgi:glycosyltransferase involved in cell wall biosynthesis